MLRLLGKQLDGSGGPSRRTMLQAGVGLLGLSLPKVLAAESFEAPRSARAKSVIFLYLHGGPSQLETFDMKPDGASEIRGPFQPVASRTPDLRICEHLSRCAAVSDKFCVLRTLSHTFPCHSTGSYYIQTGAPPDVKLGQGDKPTPTDWPAMGSVVEYLEQHRDGPAVPVLPNYVVLPNPLGRLMESGASRRPGEYAGWLGRRYDPLATRIDKKGLDDNPYYRDCSDAELTFQIPGLEADAALSLDRLNRRKSLLEQFDAQQRRIDRSRAVESYDAFRGRAFELASSQQARQVFDVRKEPARLRDRYGRHLFGQATLLARRLVQAGVRFVTVHWETVDAYNWDSHRSSYHLGRYLIPGLDQALSALLVDLDDRGLLDETLVVALGEMGRTPKANKNWGREHWPKLFPAVLAGAGIKAGSVYGTSDRDAAYAIENPQKPEDLAATIYYALGIDPELILRDTQGRPTSIVRGGVPIRELFG